MKLQTIRCVGVPEHFNLPWKLALEKKLFEASGINLIWEDAHGGTGAMCKDLAEDKADLAIALTEGAISNIQKGLSAKICSFFVDSPLIWGVHVGGTTNLSKKELQNKATFAISRFTSGSHLMAFLYMKNLGARDKELQFNVIKHLRGAIENLTTNPDQLFLWEKFTTKPYVSAGDFIRIDEISTPWPAFSVVASNQFLTEQEDTVMKVLDIVQNEARLLKLGGEKTVELIAQRYALEQEDAKEWFRTIRWSENTQAELSALDFVAIILDELGLTEKRALLKDFYYPLQD